MFGLGINRLGASGTQAIAEPETLLFANDEEGIFLDFTTSQVYADTAGTDPAEVGEGIALTDDRSPNDTDATQATSTARPIFGRVPVGGRRNLLTYTEEFDNAAWVEVGATVSGTKLTESATTAPHNMRQSIGVITGTFTAFFDVSAAERTLCEVWVLNSTNTRGAGARFNLSTGEVVSTRSTAVASLVSSSITPLGGGVYRCGVTVLQAADASTFAQAALYTVADGTATSTFSYTGDGTSGINVFKAQAELSEDQSAYQRVTTQHDITEAGVPSVYKAFFDNTDDILPITLPTITGGTVALVGLNGIWIEDDWDYAGGTLNIGPTTIAGLPAGILDVVGDLCAVIINDRAWTAAERAGVVAWGKARGAPGVFSLGPELVTNGTFDSDVSGWTPHNAGIISQESGRLRVTTVNAFDGAYTSFATSNQSKYVLGYSMYRGTNTTYRMEVGFAPQQAGGFNSGGLTADAIGRSAIFTATSLSTFITFRVDNAGTYAEIDNISVRKLELLP